MDFNMRIQHIIYSIITVCLLAFPVASQATSLQAPLFNNLGTFHRDISTKVPLAQKFFDQGFVLFYGFEWNEAIRSFTEATRLDPQCGMCYWGLALALGNKINAPMTGHEYTDAKEAIDKALSLSAYETPIERDYIKALALRFQHEPILLKKATTFSCHASSSINNASLSKEWLAYTNAMKKIMEKYPNDTDAKVLYSAALFWNTAGSNTTSDNSNVRTATRVLKAAIADDKNHVGANHYYIHLVEPSAHPEDALESANLLRTLVPGSEHLMHMPSHIYFLTGLYHQGTETNLKAITTFQDYIDTCRQQGFEPEINYLYLHNYDYLRTTATMEGRKELALSAAKKIVSSPFHFWLEHDEELQWFIPIPYFVNARFGLWKNILKEPMPKEKYQYAVGMWHYARGMAFAHTKNVKSAGNELLALQSIIHKGSINENLGNSGYNLLTIANEVLIAVIACANGNEKLTLAHLETANKIQQEMGYHEPPDWYFPVRQVLGDAYLQWKHPKDAIKMYRQDLKQYPLNGWSLYGLGKALRMLKRDEEADHVEIVFNEAWKYADDLAPTSTLPRTAKNL